MRYGFYLPTRGHTATPEALETLVARGEALGFSSVMIADHIVFPTTVDSKYPYTADGRFHFITVRTGVPKYASGDPSRPSPEEAMAVASGVIAYTGTYTLDESMKTAHLNIETSSVPNFVGDPNQRRIVTSITDEELKITNPLRPGVTLELVFKRAK